MKNLPWENWNDIYNEVIDPLTQEGAEVRCDVIIVAKGDAAIRENTIELGDQGIVGTARDSSGYSDGVIVWQGTVSVPFWTIGLGENSSCSWFSCGSTHTKEYTTMIDAPCLIDAASFQDAWITATRHLRQNRWVVRNLVVYIVDPVAFDQSVHDRVSAFANDVKTLGPKHVAYTIFPHGLHTRCRTAGELYDKYNRRDGLCKRLVRRSDNQWGTYFQRLTAYLTPNGIVNQLGDVIAAIRKDANTFTAAFTMVIQKPGGETTRRLGGPCLNYLAVQLDAEPPRRLGLLCVYRNHDFLKRAYGNYWGLCNLLRFMATETKTTPGPLTCISSQAFVDAHKTKLKGLLDSLP